MLTDPRPAGEIAAALGISSQAVHQHLAGLMAEGRVQALRRRRGLRRVWYSRVEDVSRPMETFVPERFDGGSDKALRRLRPDLFYGMDQIGQLLSTEPPRTTLTVDKLVLDGHLWTLKVAGKRLCVLTARGAAYGVEIGKFDDVQADPIASLIGERRAQIILATHLRPERTIKDLKAASVVLEMSSDIQISKKIKSLRDDGLRVSCTLNFPGRHSLSPMGTLLATFIERQG